MAKLNDIRNIIKPLPSKYNDSLLLDLDNILENLIIQNNMIYNIYIFNHIIYNNNELKSTIIELIKKHIINNIKNKRTEFRQLNKRNKLDVSHFNTYFDNMYKLLYKLNGMFHHIEPIVYDENKRWGSNLIAKHMISSIVRILTNDLIFSSAMLKSFSCNEKRNIHMERFVIYIKTFAAYKDCLYNDFLIKFDNICIKTIPIPNLNESLDRITHIYKFKYTYNYYINIITKYFYITQGKKLPLFEQELIISLQNIIVPCNILTQDSNHKFINSFLLSYKNEIQNLIKYIDISYILLSYKPNNINTFISYYSTLYEVSINNNTYINIINQCIKEDCSRFFNNSQNINELAEIINNSIMSKSTNTNQLKLYYKIGYNIINKDEFINYISRKFMERIIYTNIDSKIETEHLDILQNQFNNENIYIYKYKTIYEDYVYSKEFIKEYENLQLIITSLDVWTINHKIGFSNNIYNFGEFTTLLCNACYKYSITKHSLNISKKLIIYSHMGYVDINIGNTNLIVLPAQMFILELFDTFEKVIPYYLILSNFKQNMDNYNDDFIIKIINSLVNSKIIIINNDNVQLNNYIKQIDYINLVEYFYNTIDIIEQIQNDIQIELALERYDIINANINHLIKTNKYTLDELYNITKSTITIFNVSKELFDKSIDKMINNDYIEIIDNIVQKIYY
jgi:hypothetical protein